MRSLIRLAHLSDTHLVGEPGALAFGRDSAASLAAVVDAFQERPDVVVMTGDLADDGNVEAYRRVLALTSGMADELHAVAGNHDDRAGMDEVFVAGSDVRVVPLSPRWTMLLVNSQWLGHGAGRIDHATLYALDEALAATTQHVVVCMHHPPASTCNGPYCGIVNAAETMSVFHRHQHVRAVLSGHLHRAFDNTHDGIRFLGAAINLLSTHPWWRAAFRADIGAARSKTHRSSRRRRSHLQECLRTLRARRSLGAPLS